MRNRWTDEQIDVLRALSAKGMTASEIGAEIGATKHSVITAAFHHQIQVILHTDAEIYAMKQRQRIREKRKNDKRKALTKPKPKPIMISVEPDVSRTSSFFRKQLPKIPEMTKNELRAMLADAVRNTAEMV